MISRTTIEKVFEAARLEEVIGDFVQLRKSGSNLKGLSPFSEEKSPSFMVSPVKQIWKDFSSGKGGNVVSFLMEAEHFSYPEAIRFLAKKYQIEIEETEQTDEQKEALNEREELFVVSEYARDYFKEILHTNEEGKAIGATYFKERGFTQETIDHFELGYCLDSWNAFTNTAIDKGYALKGLEGTGLTIVKDNRQFDRFKGRVMFPIHSMSGRVLGFGGRILSDTKKAAKYLNSPESPIYHKSKILYGLYQAKQSMAKEDNCFLVEGYTDVISLHQKGLKNVVASSGTALTSDQIRLIHRLTANVTILFDGDAAGIRASLRGIDLILEQGLNVRVLMFPDGMDPDSFSKTVSTEELKSYVTDKSQDFINFKVSLLLEDAANDPIKKAGLIRDIVTSISKIPDRIKQEVYLQECATIMHISENVLFNELAQLNKRSDDNSSSNAKDNQSSGTFEVVKNVERSPKIDELAKYEYQIIRILLLYGNNEVEFVDWIEAEEQEEGMPIVLEKTEYQNSVCQEIYLQLQEDEIEFANPNFKNIYQDIIHQINQVEKITLDGLIQHMDTNISALVTDVLMDEEKHVLSDWESKDILVKTKEDSLSKLVLDAIYNIRRVLIESKIMELMGLLGKDNDSRNIMEDIKNYTELKKLLFDRLNRVA